MPFSKGGNWVPIYHNVAGVEAYLQAKFHLDPSILLAVNFVIFSLRAMILINLNLNLIQPFDHNTPTLQTHRQDRTGQWSDSIGRTVLQTVRPKTVVVTTDLREKNEAERSTYTPEVAVPDAEVSDEIWRLQALLDEEDRSAFVTSRRIGFHVVLPHNNHHSLAQLPISRR